MQSGVRDANQLINSLRAIEQICAFARISLNLQNTDSFEDACNNLLELLKEEPYLQSGYEESLFLCLKIIKEHAGPDQIGLTLKVFDKAYNSNKLASELQSLLRTWSEELRNLKLESRMLEPVDIFENKLDYMLHLERTLGPIKVMGRKANTSCPFFIGANAFSRMHTNIKKEYGYPRSSALLLVLNIWKANSHPSHTYWPQNVSIMLNGFTINTKMRRQFTQSKQPTVNFTISKDGCIDITSLIVKGKNMLVVQKSSKDMEDFNLSIEMYSVEMQETVVELVKQNGLPEHVWRNMLKRLLAKSPSADISSRANVIPDRLTPFMKVPDQTDVLSISQDSLRISAKCPITLRTIRTPVRGVDCKHFDCFELESYLLVNRGMADWKCPLCNQYTPPKKLVYDMYLQSIFTDIPSYASEIEFRKDIQVADNICHEFIVHSPPEEPVVSNSIFHHTPSIDLHTVAKEPNEPFTIVELDD